MIISKKQSIHYHIKSNFEPNVFANRQDIEQMIKNLIINALDYCDENCNVDICLEPNLNNVKLSVRYSRKNDKQYNLKQILDESFSSDNKYQKIAYGLNLYISKQIVEAYNGILTLKQNKKCGLIVSVSIPKKIKNYFRQFCINKFRPSFQVTK